MPSSVSTPSTRYSVHSRPRLTLLAPCSLPVLGLPRLSCHCAFGLFSFHLIDGANELRKFRIELLIAADDGLDGVVAASNFLPHRKICSVPYTTPRRSLSLPRRLPFHRQGPRTPMRRCSVAVARRERAQQVCFLARDFRLARVWAGTPRRYSKSSAGRPCGGGGDFYFGGPGARRARPCERGPTNQFINLARPWKWGKMR